MPVMQNTAQLNHISADKENTPGHEVSLRCRCIMLLSMHSLVMAHIIGQLTHAQTAKPYPAFDFHILRVLKPANMLT